MGSGMGLSTRLEVGRCETGGGESHVAGKLGVSKRARASTTLMGGVSNFIQSLRSTNICPRLN